jgi:hypothetical protein
MAAKGRIKSVMLDDAGLEIEVVWESGISEFISAEADSVPAAQIQLAAEEVIRGHLTHLQQDDIILGEPPPGMTQ